ncbi:MAG TPA: HlyD family secretion protein [Terriglobales bacterium]|nr:HlyD family secretion protein [Terriglobales bacterium]
MPDSRKPQEQELELQDPDLHGPWPEEDTSVVRKRGPRAYLREHPGVRYGLIAGFIILVVAGVLVWHYYYVRESTDDAQVDGHITPISARVGGTVISINFQDNQEVAAGAILVQLDPKDYQVAVERTKAELADAQASAAAARTNVPITHTSTATGIDAARANLVAAQREVEAANARLREAQANAAKVGKDLERFKQLITKDEVSRQQYDAAVAADQSARATVDAAGAAVATAQSHVIQAEAAVRGAETGPQQVRITEARAGSAEAAVQKAQANLAQAELNLQYCIIRAPQAGVVSKRSVEVGQTIQPGQPLAALVNLADVYITANFKETQLKNMHPGQAVTISIDAFGKDLKGHVDSIGGATGGRFSLLPADNATGNYVKVVQRVPVKIVLDPGEDQGHRLRPGMSVVPTVYTGK